MLRFDHFLRSLEQGGKSDMLQKDRLYRIQEKMKQAAMPQMLVTDPVL